ncbi:hypothetical protein D9758_001734 [Tetrapyrgos nigripes]|uniref:Cyclic-AMP phosphodiesterase n=1 Tax=Tetrapyrgos nigripes TaxID=182062 RepID=A0A8H5GXD8_9AGAR|nr:hypothetical protein D9758_001734 [Tetrapyrgos nigripes]
MSTHVFDLVVVGSGGGVDETDLSAYLLKPSGASWDAGIIALEAGSGKGALKQILFQNPDLFNTDSSSPLISADQIYNLVQCFLVTHSHLDHVACLAIMAGSLSGTRKRVYALMDVLEDLQEHIFNDRLWPKLGSFDDRPGEDYKYLYTALDPQMYHKLESFPNVSVKVALLNHGHAAESGRQYHSSAFFIQDNTSGKEFLFFGDVQPDSLSSTPLTIDVWRDAAPKIPDILNVIFIECSWPSSREDSSLYGHLKPEHLRDEIISLATQVYLSRNPTIATANGSTAAGTSHSGTRSPRRKKRKVDPPAPVPAPPVLEPGSLHGILKGLRVYVMHCKDQLNGQPGSTMKDLIVSQVQTLVEAENLGVEIFSVDQGTHIRI